ncbi:MAG TPA: hypothetical protein VMT85_05145 [Thermoanaerobaculia bacterium]|nr:hypothetical protein [Thermoanaerobaculia bacterium]
MASVVSMALLLCDGASSPAAAQVTLLESTENERPSLPEEFLTLVGRFSAVRYTPGSLDRAHHVLGRLETVAARLNRWSDVPISKAVYLLDRKQWAEAKLPGIYGVPLPLGPTAIAVPALGDPETVALWRRVLGVDVLPMIPGIPLRGTPEEAATLAIADQLLQIESGRALVERSGLRPDRAWIAELAAHTAALSLVAALEEQRLPEIEATLARIAERLGGAGAYSLDAYSPLLLLGDEGAIKHWLWAQGAFSEGAAIIVAQDGKRAVPRMLKLAQAKDARGLSLAALVERYPELEAWRARYWTATSSP